MTGSEGVAGRGAGTERLRDDIDKGRSGGKVPASDPAAAPLGADDEAGGAPPSPEAVAAARRDEARPPEAPAPVAADRPRGGVSRGLLFGGALAAAAVILAALAMLLAV